MGTIELEVYCDEINRVSLSTDNSEWMYLGILFVSLNKRKELLRKLLDGRCVQYNSWVWSESDCPYNCGYHSSNNTEIHYHDLQRSNARFRIAYRWINDFLINENNKKNEGLVYFNILGINLTNLNLKSFGSDRGRDLTIYNRFFRTALKSGAKYFFSEYDNIIIKKIYHDKGNQESHKYFPWYTNYKINVEDSVLSVESEDIIFIDSDHRNYLNQEVDYRNESQFIQFIDIILGSIYSSLHNPIKKGNKKKIGLAIKPLLKRLLEAPRNPNSSYHHYRKQQISFFPKRSIANLKEAYRQLDIFGNDVDLEKQRDYFFTKRDILLIDENQTSLSNFNEK